MTCVASVQALHQAAVEEIDSEIANMRELINIGTGDITTLQATLDQIREERIGTLTGDSARGTRRSEDTGWQQRA